MIKYLFPVIFGVLTFQSYGQSEELKNSIYKDERFTVNDFCPIGLKLSDPFVLGGDGYTDLKGKVASVDYYEGSTKERKVSFNKNGYVTEEIEYSGGKAKKRNVNSYDAKGNFTGETRYVWNTLKHKEHIVREDGNKTVYHLTSPEKNVWDTLQVQYFYYSNDQCDSIINDMHYWDTRHKIAFGYRTNGKLVSADHYFKDLSSPALIYFYVYKKDQLVAIHDYSGVQIEFKYNEEGELTYAGYPKKELIYENGLPVKMIVEGEVGDEQLLVYSNISYKYDNKGNWIEKKTVSNDGSSKLEKRKISYY